MSRGKTDSPITTGCRALTVILALAVASAASSPVLAADERQGFFAGGSVGRNSGTTNGYVWSPAGYGFEAIGGDARAWRLFGGYRWPYFALEGGYRDLGTQSAAPPETSIEFRYTGLDVLAVGIWPVGRLDLFAKAGVLDYRREERAETWHDSGRYRTPLVGLGVAIHFSPVALRIEWERSGVGDPINEHADFASVVSLGLVVTF